MNNYAYVIWIPLLPLATFVLLGLFGKKYFSRSAGLLASCALLISCALSFIAAWQYFFVDGRVNDQYRAVTVCKYNWLSFSPGMSIDMGIVLDPVTIMMLVVVTFVSLMVHLFSTGYMKGESRFATYYSFLSLFTFSMLALVLSSNLFQVYMFWELVGVSSFLLIGYYFEKPSAVAAAKKAFIVTRFADLGFLIGILILAFYGRSLDIGTLIGLLSDTQSPLHTGITTGSLFGISAFTWALALIFAGGAGKSAMFPLHIWLPDAMEGPTPVSALIHAATMVVAGVYLVARLFPLFTMDVAVMNLITYAGAFSALFAALIACTQTDIKRVLAYSTMSQIGYMMFALGIAGQTGESGLGYMASMFHLFTHAFFKSLLFLAAGSVIHFVHSNEMKDMGGLRSCMPVTHLCFLVGCLAIAGLPPFSGFFSKEEILSAAYRSHTFIYPLAVFTGMLTSFYMFRLYFRIFWNRTSQTGPAHSEGTMAMKFVLVVLAVCAATAGLIPFSSFITPDGRAMDAHIDWLFSIVPVGLSVLSIVFAMWLYKTANSRPLKIAEACKGFYRVAKNKFYVDELYLFLTRKIIFPLIGQPVAWIDRNVVDGMVNVTADLTELFAVSVRRFQSGRIQQYLLYFFFGIIAIACLFIYVWK